MDDNQPTQPTPDDEQLDALNQFLSEVEKTFEKIVQSGQHRGPTMDDVLHDISVTATSNDMELVGVVHAAKPCCTNNVHNDVIAVFIHTAETEQKIDAKDSKYRRLSPGFRTILFCCYDFHHQSKSMIVYDIDAAMQMQNILGTAIKTLQDRRGPDPLERLFAV